MRRNAEDAALVNGAIAAQIDRLVNALILVRLWQ